MFKTHFWIKLKFMKIDRIVRSKRKTMALIVHRDGSLEVRAPLFTSDRQIFTFVQSKIDWLIKKGLPPVSLYMVPQRVVIWRVERSPGILGNASRHQW